MTDEGLRPEQVESRILELENRIARGAGICNERYVEFLTADREYDQAFAHAYLGAKDHPAHERRYVAELATADLRKARDIADAAYRYAKGTGDSYRDQLSALQSVSKSVLAMWGVAGRAS